jgi:protein-tyrosine phosphatase
MDTYNYKNVIALAPDEKSKEKVKIILKELHTIDSFEVPDPYYGEIEDFEKVFHLIDEVCAKIANKI